jgi:hypothetical protein
MLYFIWQQIIKPSHNATLNYEVDVAVTNPTNHVEEDITAIPRVLFKLNTQLPKDLMQI